MFRAANAFDEPVAKATDENLTSENWELNLLLCDKLASNKEADARQCLSAIQKRVVHRNANVQLYALTLVDTLSKNCGDAMHHEIASRAFMQTITKVVRDRSTHALVKQRALQLLKAWADEYKNDDTLGLVADTVHQLREEYYDIDEEPKAPAVPDEQRREEDELQRVLALSLQDQGGPSNWSPTPAAGPSGTARAAEPDPRAAPAASVPATAPAEAPPQAAPSEPKPPVTRPAFVRALYDFVPDEPGELALKKGDKIRVLDSVYEQWWRGEVRQQVGIFPVNYVEPVADETPDLLQEVLELERVVFSQASDIHLLHARLQHLQPTDNFVDDDELQELYQRALALRPKIVKLMDRYHTKVQELRSLNDKFVRARSTLDQLIQGRLEAETPSATSSPPAPSSSSAPIPALMDVVPQEDEKRRLFERARAEVEEYHRQQQASTSQGLEGLQWS
ncbi:hypothetical protein MNAN1_003036 [Malassezia nana]|uniref:Class E vacuolar protein-sorting machinery protein HSE1 n=1 Tax=Malassezia nana TaxID=180528 RepID=A0AAF0J4H7_9BASI|nr:hypothetical protein MNAN1_003036 [Malassezia nana]